MSLTTILFDLDGTLLPMDQEIFTKSYFKRIAARLAPLGYEPQELIKNIWGGTAAMIKNKSGKNNEEVFWEFFSGVYGEKSLDDKPHFDEFYKTDFQKVKDDCGFTPKAAETVRALKKGGYRVALATNPIFPSIATESRIRWAGLEPEDFELYTTYENIGSCKPNPDYYIEIMRRMDVKPEECLMVGNDVADDMVAEKIGMKVFLLTDCLINKDETDISVYPNGSFEDLLKYVEEIR